MRVVKSALAEYGVVVQREPAPKPKQPDRVDAWMKKPLYYNVPRQKLFLLLLALPTLVPFIFMSRPLFAGDSNALNTSVADVLGTSSAIFLFLCLLVTPIRTVTGQTWFVPLRQWYGIAFAFSAILDATTASLVTGPSFAHGPLGRLTGHSFLLVGAIMISLAIPLLLTANRYSQRMLGKYWKIIQRFTYGIWALLLLHMALLFGFNPHKDPGDVQGNLIIFQQRFFQIAALTVLLFFWRIPAIKRWAQANAKSGQSWKTYAVFAPIFIGAIIFFGFMISEEIFKGAAIFTLHPINN
jgi:DMSO/TMAO reductase YedYZ heme-binding membrane subunit